MATDLITIAAEAIRQNVSDIHLTAGQRIFFRKDGKLYARDYDSLTETEIHGFLRKMLTDSQLLRLREERNLDFSWTACCRRFRVNAYFQRNRPAAALRLIPDRIPGLRELGVPKALYPLLSANQGLLLVTGRTGSGKSTTLAAFLSEMNTLRPSHILTLEDPLEFEHHSETCFISQRELGRDFLSFPDALKSALREMPDVILVGEIRDPETMQTAMEAASTGIFVLGTLHTNGAAETAMRVEGMFPLNQRDTVRDRFASVLLGILSQQLLPAAGGGRVNACEMLLATPAARNLIRQGKYAQLPSVMMSGQSLGMCTMESSVRSLTDAGRLAGTNGTSNREARL